jgi:Domain of unknown function (DUF4157)
VGPQHEPLRREATGTPLDQHEGRPLERSFGTDLSDVLVRTDPNSDAAARSIGGRGFSVGNEISFAFGAFRPGDLAGRRLLAHEIAHVIQQRGGNANGSGHAADPEADADQAARAAVSGAKAIVQADRPGAVRRAGDIRAMSITDRYARALSDDELREQLGIIDAHLATLAGASVEHGAARENQRLLQEERVRRLVQGRDQSASAAQRSMSGFELVAVTGMVVGDTVSARHARFQQAVLLSAQYRLAQNQEHLAEWRALIDTQMSAVTLRIQVLAQSAVDLRSTAQRTGGMPAFNAWAGETNPYMRNVYEHQAHGEWRVCAGCHMAVQAGAMAQHEQHVGAAWRSPADTLSGLAGLPYGGPSSSFSDENAAQVMAAVQAIRPMVAPLGDQGYRIIPDDVFSLRSNLTPEALRGTLLGRLDQRRADYAELSARIGNGDISYLQLGPILQDLLPMADDEVRQAVRADIDSEHRWAIIKIGGTIILALLSILFPPLALAVAALAFGAGFGSYQQGNLYRLGTGANNVFTREQQDSAGTLMASGVFNMAMAAAVIASAAPGALDMAATRAITSSDLAVAQRLAQRALAGPIPEAELLQLQQPGLVGRVGHGWAELRNFQVLYRGQGAATSEILSPAARAGGLGQSRALYDAMKAQGLTDLEIAGFTAKFNAEAVPAFAAPPGMEGQPLGGVGIPTTRLPNIAADFANQPTGVIYVLRVPKGLAVPAAEVGWGAQSALEQEWVVFHQLPNGMVVRVLPSNAAAPLRFDAPPGVGPSLAIPPPAMP